MGDMSPSGDDEIDLALALSKSESDTLNGGTVRLSLTSQSLIGEPHFLLILTINVLQVLIYVFNFIIYYIFSF